MKWNNFFFLVLRTFLYVHHVSGCKLIKRVEFSLFFLLLLLQVMTATRILWFNFQQLQIFFFFVHSIAHSWVTFFMVLRQFSYIKKIPLLLGKKLHEINCTCENKEKKKHKYLWFNFKECFLLCKRSMTHSFSTIWVNKQLQNMQRKFFNEIFHKERK